jgi:hypothetical protein
MKYTSYRCDGAETSDVQYYVRFKKFTIILYINIMKAVYLYTYT